MKKLTKPIYLETDDDIRPMWRVIPYTSDRYGHIVGDYSNERIIGYCLQHRRRNFDGSYTWVNARAAKSLSDIQDIVDSYWPNGTYKKMENYNE